MCTEPELDDLAGLTPRELFTRLSLADWQLDYAAIADRSRDPVVTHLIRLRQAVSAEPMPELVTVREAQRLLRRVSRINKVRRIVRALMTPLTRSPQ